MLEKGAIYHNKLQVRTNPLWITVVRPVMIALDSSSLDNLAECYDDRRLLLPAHSPEIFFCTGQGPLRRDKLALRVVSSDKVCVDIIGTWVVISRTKFY